MRLEEQQGGRREKTATRSAQRPREDGEAERQGRGEDAGLEGVEPGIQVWGRSPGCRPKGGAEG